MGTAIRGSAVSVAEATEARCRRVMAERAALRLTWMTRDERAAKLAEVDVLLEEFNLLTLGR